MLKINITPFYHQSPAAFTTDSFGTNTFRADTRGRNVLLLPGSSRISPAFQNRKKTTLFPRMVEHV